MENLRSSFFFKRYFPVFPGLVFFVAALLCATDCRAEQVKLAWDPSPDTVTGYILFYGEQSDLTKSATAIDVGNVLQYTVINLAAGKTYYFAVKAYNADVQSGFSNIVKYPDTGTTTTSAASTSSIPPNTLPATSSSSSVPITSASSSVPATFSTTSIASGILTTTTAEGEGNHIMGAKGAGSTTGGTPAVESEHRASAAADPAFTDQGAIAIFENSDLVSQLSVGWDAYNALNGEARIATGDIDGDGKDEVIICLGPVAGNAEIPGGKFQILDDDFTNLGWGQIEWPDYNAINGECWPACGDIDGDGVDEILIGMGVGGQGRIEVFKFKNGQAVHEKWIKVGWEEYCEAGGGVRPACGNINFDRKDEIILGLYPVNDVFLPEGKFEVLNGNGKHLTWGVVDWPEYNALNGETRPACGDINRTVRDEILLGLGPGSGGRIPVYSYILGAVTLKTWLSPAGEPAYRDENGETRLSCGDMDGDGMDEILVGFGHGGQGMMELHDDGLHDFSVISRLQMSDEDYNMASGETYPAIRGKKLPKGMNFFLKLTGGEKPKQH